MGFVQIIEMKTSKIDEVQQFFRQHVEN